MDEAWKIKKILLIGTRYHAFILTEAGLICSEDDDGQAEGYCKPNPNTPVFYTAYTEQEALDLLKVHSDIDMVHFDCSFQGKDPFVFSADIKRTYPRKIITTLLTSKPDYYYSTLNIKNRGDMDYIFMWNGNSQIVKSMIRLIEDKENADRDILQNRVAAVLVVEDEPIFYSRFLPILYSEIIGLSADIRGKTGNKVSGTDRRPKVLLCENYESASECLNRYGEHVIGVISDIQFPKNKCMTEDAGIQFCRQAKAYRENIPVLLQSKNQEQRDIAHNAGAYFIWKDSDMFLKNLRTFMLNYFGFGNFIFRMPGANEVASAGSLQELLEQVKTINVKSILYHAERQHFSSWLNIHGYFELADRLYKVPKTLPGEEIRKELIDYLTEYVKKYTNE